MSFTVIIKASDVFLIRPTVALQRLGSAATKAWGRELPKISQDTLDAANKLFEDYYRSKEQDKTTPEI